MKNFKFQKIYIENNNGQALLTAMAVIGTILMSIITIAGYLAIQRVRTSRAIIESGAAFTRADAGIEAALNAIRAEEYFLNHPGSSVVAIENASITRITAPCSGYHIVSRGEVGNGVRAIELNLCE